MRTTLVAVVISLLGLATALIALTLSGPIGSTNSGSAPASAGAPTPIAAWVDYYGRLHVGDLATWTERAVAAAGATATTPLVIAGGRLYWMRPPRFDPTNGVMGSSLVELDPMSGQQRSLGPGSGAFPSADGRRLFVETGPRSLVQLDPGSGHVLRRWAVPKGWFLGQDNLRPPMAVANSVLVVSAPEQAGPTPPTLGVWNLQTGEVSTLGPAVGLVASHTPPGGHHSLLAWLPDNCQFLGDHIPGWFYSGNLTASRTDFAGSCSMRITDMTTMVTKQITSPLGSGFDAGGAFSPDGHTLASFVRSGNDSSGPRTQLLLVDVDTGTRRVVPGTVIGIGDAVAWARWLPHSAGVMVGSVPQLGGGDQAGGRDALKNGFIVSSSGASVAPLRFSTTPEEAVNYSVAVFAGSYRSVTETPAAMRSASALGAPVVSLRPDGSLSDLQTVRIQGSGFVPGVPVRVNECRPGIGPTLRCDTGTASYTMTDSRGRLSTHYEVSVLISVDGVRISCAEPHTCVLQVSNYWDQLQQQTLPLTFASGLG